jgi:methylated-DNA-[protein]-cysteine S-methyltransferase
MDRFRQWRGKNMSDATMEHPGAADYDAIVTFPGFSLGICSDGDAIVAIDFLEPCDERGGRQPLAQAAVRQLRGYLKDPTFQFNLPLAPAGTAYQQRVWAGIAAIPAGQTRSYGELADTLKSSARAVGTACGANPYPIVVPCHRVIASDGSLGGFSRQRGGFLLEAKRWLLHHEGIQ